MIGDPFLNYCALGVLFFVPTATMIFVNGVGRQLSSKLIVSAATAR
jgi:hypothetical protein